MEPERQELHELADRLHRAGLSEALRCMRELVEFWDTSPAEHIRMEAQAEEESNG